MRVRCMFNASCPANQDQSLSVSKDIYAYSDSVLCNLLRLFVTTVFMWRCIVNISTKRRPEMFLCVLILQIKWYYYLLLGIIDVEANYIGMHYQVTFSERREGNHFRSGVSFSCV